MLDIQEKIEKQGFLREPTEDRIALYELMRKKYPKGKKEMQLRLAMEISDDRIANYVDIFNSTK
jgi:hypothetical protein